METMRNAALRLTFHKITLKTGRRQVILLTGTKMQKSKRTRGAALGRTGSQRGEERTACGPAPSRGATTRVLLEAEGIPTPALCSAPRCSAGEPCVKTRSTGDPRRTHPGSRLTDLRAGNSPQQNPPNCRLGAGVDSATRGHLSTEAKKDVEDREGTELRRLEKPQERGSQPRAQRAMWSPRARERPWASVAEPPRKMARGTAVSTRGLGWGAGGPARQTRERRGYWGPGALEGGGTHGRAEVAAAGAALVLHHPAPVVLTQHQQRRLAGRTHQLMLHHTVRAPAQLPSGETGSAHHTQHGAGAGKQRGQAAQSSTSTQPTRRNRSGDNGSRESRCPPPLHRNQECAGCTTVCLSLSHM